MVGSGREAISSMYVGNIFFMVRYCEHDLDMMNHGAAGGAAQFIVTPMRTVLKRQSNDDSENGYVSKGNNIQWDIWVEVV